MDAAVLGKINPKEKKTNIRWSLWYMTYKKKYEGKSPVKTSSEYKTVVTKVKWEETGFKGWGSTANFDGKIIDWHFGDK